MARTTTSLKLIIALTAMILLTLLVLTERSLIAEEVMIYPVPSLADNQPKSQEEKLKFYSHVGRGHYTPLQLRNYTEKRETHFETAFEETSPGRNTAANEWSAFGIPGDKTDFNAMGREMWVRYPAFDLAFRLYKDGKEIKPDSLDSFRLGLVNNRLPAIWGGWQDNGLLYKVSVMTVPSKNNGNYDLFKIDIQNPTDKPVPSNLVVAVDGSPDLRLEDGVVRGLGNAPFVIADDPASKELMLRDWGLCDKRAKTYQRYSKKGLEDPIRTYRLGIDGLPVVYRFKVQPDKKYLVYLATPLRIAGHHIGEPKALGDYIAQYQVEGCPSQTLDYIDHIQQNEKRNEPERPLLVKMDGAQDKDGDGYIEVRAGVAPESKLKYTALGLIYVFNEGTVIDSEPDLYAGKLNDKCLWHIDVGCTPDQDWKNQYYDASDCGLARLKLNYTAPIPPGKVQTYWLKVPPIYRREAISMIWIGHAFRDVFPGEAIPPFDAAKVASLKKADPKADMQATFDYWNAFFANAAQFDLPDPTLADIFYSRLATRAILDVKINDNVWFNACSPFFYFDFSYRDHCYSVVSREMAGLPAEAEKLANTYCNDAKDVKEDGPIWFPGKPLKAGMQDDGYWLTRPGQHDSPGQNLWGVVEHYKYTGDKKWLENKAWPFIRRGAMWVVNSRHKVMAAVGNPDDPRYGLIEPGAMEVHEYEKGVYMYYMDAFAVLGLKQTADAALALGKKDDYKLFQQEYLDMKNCLYRSFQKTFKRTGLYSGHLWFGVEPEAGSAGMYGDWANNAILWPCRVIEPFDDMWTATLRNLEYKNQTSGAGLNAGWPYIGVDLAVSNIIRGERDKTLDYFCAYTDAAGSTFSWGEGFDDILYWGDQPHNWADVYWIILFRNLFAFEDGNTLMLTPALFRYWHQGEKPIIANGLPTYFGTLNLKIQPALDGKTLDYTFSITPKGDQAKKPLDKIVLFPRTALGKPVDSATLNGKPITSFSRDTVIIPNPARGKTIRLQLKIADD